MWRSRRRFPLALAMLPLALRPLPAQEAGELFFDEAVEAADVSALQVDLYDADVRLVSGTDGRVAVRAWVRAADDDREFARSVADRMELSLVRRGGAVEIGSRRAGLRPSEWRNHRGVSVWLEVRHPPRVDLELTTEDGDVEIEAVEGRSRVRTADGDVVIGTARGPELRLDTADGDVRVDRIDTGRVRIETGDGDLHVRRTSAALEARARDGDLIVGIEGGNELVIHTGEGDIVLFAPAGLAADLDLSGEDVVLDAGFSFEGSHGGREIRGRLNGGGPRLEARTREGTVALKVGPMP